MLGLWFTGLAGLAPTNTTTSVTSKPTVSTVGALTGSAGWHEPTSPRQNPSPFPQASETCYWSASYPQ